MLNFLKKNWYWLVGAIVLIVVVCIVIRRRNAKNEEEKENILSGGSGSNGSEAKFPLTPYSLANEYSKEKGSMGSQIKTLQMIYNANNKSGTPLDVDGKYGPKTLGAFLGFFYDMIATNGTITQAQYEQIVKKFNNE